MDVILPTPWGEHLLERQKAEDIPGIESRESERAPGEGDANLDQV